MNCNQLSESLMNGCIACSMDDFLFVFSLEEDSRNLVWYGVSFFCVVCRGVSLWCGASRLMFDVNKNK